MKNIGEQQNIPEIIGPFRIFTIVTSFYNILGFLEGMGTLILSKLILKTIYFVLHSLNFLVETCD